MISPPKVILGRARRYPTSKNAFPLHVLAVACTMRNKTLWSVTGRYGSVTERYGTLQKRYGALTERYGTVMENIDFAHH